MGKKDQAFESFVTESILSNNQFGIQEVKDLTSLKSVYYIEEEYTEIENLINERDILAIRMFKEGQPCTEEYLDVMLFKDQNDKMFIVTVFDSNLLEQDPQIIEVYSL